jgi:hypothetical protein
MVNFPHKKSSERRLRRQTSFEQGNGSMDPKRFFLVRTSHTLRPLFIVLAIFACFLLFNFLTSGLSSASTGGSADKASESKASKQANRNKPATKSDNQKTLSPTASTGTQLFMINGSGSGTGNGDYTSDADGVNTMYRYYIEVPAGTTRLSVDLFDADIGIGDDAEATAGRDRARNDTFNTAANYTLFNPAGAQRTANFTLGDNDEPASSDNAWLNFFDSTGDNVRDEFGTAAYTNNDGNVNWAGNWIETNDDNTAGGGQIIITGGELRIGDNGNTNTSRIEREANLSGNGFSTATFSFDYRTTGVDAGDQMVVEVSANGGGAWTTLETFTGAVSGSRSYNITSSIATNTRIRFRHGTGYGNNDFFFVDDVQIQEANTIDAGHWELRIDQSSAVTAGDDINAIGIRAHDGTSGAGGTELNVYADSMIEMGVNPPTSGQNTRNYTLYPYITSGCNCAKNDFDYDSNSGTVGAMTFTSRSGGYVQSYGTSSLSTNDSWRRDTFTNYASDAGAIDYGVWTAALSINSYIVSGGQNGNYATFYLTNYAAAANPPTANPQANTFRIYLPKDDGTKPAKAYMTQSFSRVSGPNPPQVGQVTRYEVTVSVVNPSASAGAITFSASNLVTANVPGSGVLYVNPSSTVSQGTVTGQPANNASGNITWNPGSVAAGTTATLRYRVNVTPTAAGQRLPLTATPASGNGTRGRAVDETGNTTQARATYTLGPLCEIAVTQNVATAVDLVDFAATNYDNGVLLEWQTGFEADNLGFQVYREEDGKRVPVNSQLIAGSSLTAGYRSVLKAGESYTWWDKSQAKDAVYWLEDVDLSGASTWHGPFAIQAANHRSASPSKQKLAKLLNELNDGDAQNNSTKVVEQTASLVSTPASSGLTTMALSGAAPVLSGQSAVKISVKQEGWYRITQPELIRAGLSPNIDANLLQLSADGRVMPMKVSLNKNGRFDETSSIEFYGIGLDTPVTNVRTYWLSAGTQAGNRIQTVKADSKPVSETGFTTTVERKNRTIYFSSLRNGEQENFFGAVVSGTPVNQELRLTNVDSSATGQAELEVAMQGVTVVPHRVTVQLNGMSVGDMLFTGQQESISRFTIQHSLLQEGVNTVQLVSLNAPGDVNLVDYIRLTYQHKFIADDNALKLTLNPGEGVTVGGFTSQSIRAFDVTYETEVTELPADVATEKTGYSVTVAAGGSGRRTLLLLTDDKVKKPEGIKANEPSAWRTPNQAGNFIIITSKEFLPAVEYLRLARQSEGYKVAVVDIEDVYDEFSYGNKSPKAIKDFLAYAKSNWKTPPAYLLLVGDASYDSKNYMGYGNFDFVPTKLVDTSEMETASDEWLADFNNDNVSDLMMGRLPVRSLAEATLLINKILYFKKYGQAQSALLVSDATDGFNFEQASSQLRSFLPKDLQVDEIKRGQEGDMAKAHLLTAIQSGQKFINYAGHGSINLWRNNLLTSDDARALTNSQKLPLFVMMTCLNGYFHDPLLDSLGESLMKAENGGAVAVWASTGLTEPEPQALMNQEFFRQFSPTKPIGDAIAKAKYASGNADVQRTWIFFGDPTMKF